MTPDFLRSIVRAVERGGGSVAQIDFLVTAWEERCNGGPPTGILRTFEKEPVPLATEQTIVALRTIFSEQDPIPASEVAAALRTTTKKLAKALEPAGIMPLEITDRNSTRKGYRSSWFEGYFEQLDRAYAAPLNAIGDVVIGALVRGFDATELPPEAACLKAAHAGREWRLAGGGSWQCGACHRPADGLDVEWAR